MVLVMSFSMTALPGSSPFLSWSSSSPSCIQCPEVIHTAVIWVVLPLLPVWETWALFLSLSGDQGSFEGPAVVAALLCDTTAAFLSS